MKTKNKIKQYFPVFLLSFALFVTSFSVEAQGHRGSDRGNKHEKAEYRKSGRNQSWHADAERYRKDGRRYDREDRYYSQDEHRRYADRDDHADYYYNHPRYGRVYHRFDSRPVVLRHDHTDYYFYGNRFYTFRPGIGYCAIDFPQRMYFESLPYACDDVYVNGLHYYRYGNLYFRLFRGGYLVVPSPLEVTITARF